MATSPSRGTPVTGTTNEAMTIESLHYIWCDGIATAKNWDRWNLACDFTVLSLFADCQLSTWVTDRLNAIRYSFKAYNHPRNVLWICFQTLRRSLRILRVGSGISAAETRPQWLLDGTANRFVPDALTGALSQLGYRWVLGSTSVSWQISL
jgi:hypothetical protein